MRPNMNLPMDKIHDPTSSFGRLLIPWLDVDIYGHRRWIAIFRGGKGIRVTDACGFHNCRATGVY